jgi:hypothetical protein
VPKFQANPVISRALDFGTSLDVEICKPGFAKKQKRKPINLDGKEIVEISDDPIERPK